MDTDELDTQTYNKTPLADRMRPSSLKEIVGQGHLIGQGKPLSILIGADVVPSIIFWGPPGTGKTTLARIMAGTTKAKFYHLSAVLSGVNELRDVIKEAKMQKRLNKRLNILFVDEIHRWNKAQQDALLPHVEDGTITLIGSTTENPSFEIISPLLSRTKVYVLEPIEADELKKLIKRTLTDEEKGLGGLKLSIDDNALNFIADSADGDARRALNTLEIAVDLVKQRPASSVQRSENRGQKTEDRKQKKGVRKTPSPLVGEGGEEGGLSTIHDSRITLSVVEAALQKKSLLYDKKGEEHYNVISAFIKSMRGSDPDAAVYYLARMLDAGEEPLFIARRMVIFASEDVSNADPHAVQVAIACMQSFDFVGMPEGWIPLAQCATYLASAPKSNASYMAYQNALSDAQEHGTLSTPKHLRNAPTKLMKELGYHKGYKYAHNHEGHFVAGEEYLPDKLKGKRYYEPTENGYEKVIAERLKNWRLQKQPKK